MLKGKNGSDVVKHLSLPQIQLDMIELNVCSVSIKMDFVTIFTDFCNAKSWVYDSFRFWTKKKHWDVFCFSSAEIWFHDWVSFFCIYSKKYTGVFLCDMGGNSSFAWKNG